jgi:primary-amine oxidase
MKFFAAGVCILASLLTGLAAPAPKVNAVHHPKLSRPQLRKRTEYTNAVNISAAAPATSAPRDNVWASLSNDEAAAVIAFLHEQPALNLTLAQDSGEYVEAAAWNECHRIDR